MMTVKWESKAGAEKGICINPLPSAANFEDYA
jgi:hypothetical protein